MENITNLFCDFCGEKTEFKPLISIRTRGEVDFRLYYCVGCGETYTARRLKEMTKPKEKYVNYQI